MSPSSVTLYPKTIIPKPIVCEIIRQHMLKQLDTLKTGCIALVAPSGYGKTTLLAQYARKTKRQVVWLTLRESDIEQDNLMLSIQQAFQVHTQVQPSIRDQQSTEEFLHTLIGQLSELDEVDLILDHVEVISHIHGDFLARLVELLPEGHRILLAGYDVSGFPLARLVASGKAKVISQKQLCLSIKETQQILNYHQSHLSAHSVLAVTEGWPVGIALNALGSAQQVNIHDLLQEVIDKLPQDIIVSITELSLAEIWSEATARDLGLTLSSDWLTVLKKAGLPLTPLGNNVFKPHGLLIEILQKRLAQKPERANELYVRCAKNAKKEGKLSSAMRYAAQAAHISLLKEYALLLFPKLLKKYEFELLLKMTSLYPGKAPNWWQEYRATALIETGELRLGQDILDRLLKDQQLTALGYQTLAMRASQLGCFEDQLNFADVGLTIADSTTKPNLLIQKAYALILLEKPEKGIEVTQKIVENAKLKGDLIEEADALNIQQQALHMLRRWDERMACLNYISEIYHGQGRTVRALQIDMDRMNYYLIRGDFKRVEEFLDRSFDEIKKNRPTRLVSLYLCKSFLMFSLKRFDESIDMILKAQEYIDSYELRIFDPLCKLYLFDIYTRIQKIEEAEKAYHEAIKMSRENALFSRRIAPLAQGLYHFDQGEIDQAKQLFQKAKNVSIYQTYYIRACVMILAVEHQENKDLTKSLELTSSLLRPLSVHSVCGPDIHRLQPLIEYFQQNDLVHPLNQLGKTKREIESVSENQHVFIKTDEEIECFYAGEKMKLPLAKSGELLVWLSWHKSGSLHEILNDLWDGSRDSKHHEYFRVLVRRLRTMFKSFVNEDFNPLPYRQGKYSLHEKLKVKCDVCQALSLVKEKSYAELLQIKPDNFLKEVKSKWAARIRSAIHREQVFILDEIVSNMTPNNVDANVRLLKNAVAIQPNKEEFNMFLIRALLQRNPNEALLAFQDYSKNLKTQFESEPTQYFISELRSLGLSI